MLSNAQWEAFARNIAKGMLVGEAYVAAGYKALGNAAETNGCRLLKRAEVRTRINELQAEAAKGAVITAERLIRIGMALIEEARGAKNYNAASATLQRVAVIAGLWVEQSESRGAQTTRLISDRPVKALDEREWLARYAPQQALT